MKLLQYHDPAEGKRVGVLTREGSIIDVTTDEAPGVLELLQVAASDSVSLNILVAEMQEQSSAGRPAPAPWEDGAREELSYDTVNVLPTEDGHHP